jgi:ankyrin repeat protein
VTRNRKDRKRNEALLGAQSDVNSPDQSGWTELMKAVNRGLLERVKVLLTIGADVNKADHDGFSPLMCASVNGRTALIEILLKHGAVVDAVDDYGRTALCWAVTKGDFHETATALLAAGANVNQMDKGGFTPLMRSALSKHPRCFDLLLGQGADPRPRQPDHAATALEMAANSGDVRLVELALAHRRR